jgi:hypothetical protein
MAAGDVSICENFYVDVQEGVHNLETDTIKLALITTSTTPAVTDADPRFGAGGSTNYSTNQVTAGGNYSAGGPTIANPTVTLTSNKGRFDGDDVSIAQDASNPDNARWGIIYNDTAAGKQVIGFLDLGSVSDLTAGPFSVAWNASGIFEMGVAA